MNDQSLFSRISEQASGLGLPCSPEEIAHLAEIKDMSPDGIKAAMEIFEYLSLKKHEASIATNLRLSRLPIKEPKTFDNFDFRRFHGKEVSLLESLPSLSGIYAHKNLAFIGPQGVGKTHLAMAYGYSCCERGLKTYFIKANELNQKLLMARRNGKEGSVVNGLVKPSCLIIDEIGRCDFDLQNTRLFFDIIDRRQQKEGANCIIFTSNKSPDKWISSFHEDDTLLCALDRSFDAATVFLFKGESYRGKNLKTVALTTGRTLIKETADDRS